MDRVSHSLIVFISNLNWVSLVAFCYRIYLGNLVDFKLYYKGNDHTKVIAFSWNRLSSKLRSESKKLHRIKSSS